MKMKESLLMLFSIILVWIIIDKGEGSYCMSTDCTNTGSYQHGGLSLYLRVCCIDSNLGQSVTIRDNFNLQFIGCPKEQPKSCPSNQNENVEEPQSCQKILEANPEAESGNYTIVYPNGTAYTVYCKMDTTDCGEGGWTRIAYINMTEPGATCPDGFVTKNYNNIDHSLCGNNLSGPGCISTFFSTNDLNYSKVCGQIRGYQYHSPDGFEGSLSVGLDSYYVCGYSITRGNPRRHIWTYAGGIHQNQLNIHDCPCNTGFTQNLPPSYVGNDYYCESGLPLNETFTSLLYPNDTLWDGQQCLGLEGPCCTNPNLPWFNKALDGVSNTDYIEVRSCVLYTSADEDTPLDILELYVK